MEEEHMGALSSTTIFPIPGRLLPAQFNLVSWETSFRRVLYRGLCHDAAASPCTCFLLCIERAWMSIQ